MNGSDYIAVTHNCLFDDVWFFIFSIPIAINLFSIILASIVIIIINGIKRINIEFKIHTMKMRKMVASRSVSLELKEKYKFAALNHDLPDRFHHE